MFTVQVGCPNPAGRYLACAADITGCARTPWKGFRCMQLMYGNRRYPVPDAHVDCLGHGCRDPGGAGGACYFSCCGGSFFLAPMNHAYGDGCHIYRRSCFNVQPMVTPLTAGSCAGSKTGRALTALKGAHYSQTILPRPRQPRRILHPRQQQKRESVLASKRALPRTALHATATMVLLPSSGIRLRGRGFLQAKQEQNKVLSNRPRILLTQHHRTRQANHREERRNPPTQHARPSASP